MAVDIRNDLLQLLIVRQVPVSGSTLGRLHHAVKKQDIEQFIQVPVYAALRAVTVVQLKPDEFMEQPPDVFIGAVRFIQGIQQEYAARIRQHMVDHSVFDQQFTDKAPSSDFKGMGRHRIDEEDIIPVHLIVVFPDLYLAVPVRHI